MNKILRVSYIIINDLVKPLSQLQTASRNAVPFTTLKVLKPNMI